MKHDVPPYLQMLFSARGRLPYVRPMEKPKCRQVDYLCHTTANFVEKLEASKDDEKPDFIPKAELKRKLWFEKLEEHKERVKEEYQKCRSVSNKGSPFEQEGMTEDPKRTIIVYRLSFSTTEEKLKKEFDKYGRIKKVRIVKDLESKSRGYGFIEFEKKSEFLCRLLSPSCLQTSRRLEDRRQAHQGRC